MSTRRRASQVLLETGLAPVCTRAARPGSVLRRVAGPATLAGPAYPRRFRRQSADRSAVTRRGCQHYRWPRTPTLTRRTRHWPAETRKHSAPGCVTAGSRGRGERNPAAPMPWVKGCNPPPILEQVFDGERGSSNPIRCAVHERAERFLPASDMRVPGRFLGDDLCRLEQRQRLLRSQRAVV